jgi:hypothetical protein
MTTRFKTGANVITWIGVIVLAVAAGCKSEEVPGAWVPEPIQVDGNASEWTSQSLSSYGDEGVVLGICNDSDQLYIHVRFRDPAWAHAIRMGGLKLWIDPKAEKNKTLGMEYRGGPPPSELFANRGGMGRGEPSDDRMQRMRDMQGRMEDQLLFTDSENRIDQVPIAVDASSGPVARFDTTLGFYSYEFSIPLADSRSGLYGLGLQPGQPISIGAIWGDMDRRQKMGGPGGGPPAARGGIGGGFGGKGGGMAGGMERRGGGMPPGGMQPPEKQEFWLKTTLALPPESSATAASSEM